MKSGFQVFLGKNVGKSGICSFLTTSVMLLLSQSALHGELLSLKDRCTASLCQSHCTIVTCKLRGAYL